MPSSSCVLARSTRAPLPRSVISGTPPARAIGASVASSTAAVKAFLEQPEVRDGGAGDQLLLAVAGAAREHPYILAFGLLLSVALMGVAADLLGRVLQKQRWIAYVGLAIIVYVAFEMIYRGSLEIAPVIASL